jgi:hypothetical protein
MNIRKYFVFNIQSDDYLEPFLISAVATMLLTRFYLNVTNFPQISAGQLHIAHLLFGGVFMFIGIVLFAAFLNQPAHRAGAVLGGVGFGFFIDELGKFITADNNYFYEPTISIIYMVFILMFFGFKFLDKQHRLTSKEYLLNALEITQNLALYERDKHQKRTAINLLKKAGPSEPFVKDLMLMLEKYLPESGNEKDIIDNTVDEVSTIYHKFVSHKYFTTVAVIVFVLASLFGLYRIITIVAPYLANPNQKPTFSQLAELISTALSTALVIMGCARILKNRLEAYELFKMSLLVSIFLTQVFTFYRDQLAAITILAVNIFFYAIIQYMIKKELKEE